VTPGNRDSMLVASPEVADAIAIGAPIVALESTIISHGMPYPRNVETARAVEEEVRTAGAVPATVAVLDGAIRVGLDADQLERLASDPAVRKVSRRDLTHVVMSGDPGATTVAATMIAAAKADIRIFATGGIGGVHRGAATSFDVSADLDELGRTEVAVVCAGAKAILDIGLTLEYLETRGVPVIGYRTDEFPAFYTRGSGFAVDHRLDSPAEVARFLSVHRRLALGGGVVIGNPIPEPHALDPDTISAAIERALADAGTLTGKEATPYLLARVAELTGDASLEANIALVRANARLAGEIAVALEV
jgi:pseudouridylate synthase